jgi:hypothetical protein
MRPYREPRLGHSPVNGNRQHRLSFAGMWDDDDNGDLLLQDAVPYNHVEHRPYIVVMDDTDEEHDIIDMKRRSFLAKRAASKEQAVVDIEVDKIFDEVFTDRRTGNTTTNPPKTLRGSMISVAFTDDEVYDDDDDDDDDDDMMDYKNAKAGEMNLLHDNISNSVFYGFMMISACLVLYMVFLMFTVEADESNTVVTYVINHTKQEHPHHTLPDSPQMPMSNHKTWEHVFEDGDQEDSSSQVKGNLPDNGESTENNPDVSMGNVPGSGSVNQTIELDKAMHVTEQVFDSDRQKEGSTDESQIGRDNETGALGKAMHIAEQTFDSNRPQGGSTKESYHDEKHTASGNHTGALGKAMHIAEQTFDKEGGNTEVSHRNDEPIGFLEAPPKLEELLLLIHTNTGREIPNTSLDTTNHQERVNDDGSILHCGVKVEGNLVTVECLLGDELCGVYLGGYRCEPSDQT